MRPYLEQRQAEVADLGEQSVECCLVADRPNDCGSPGVGVAADVKAAEPDQ
jgi:hypothetical protein